jgi:predicted dehydrogenase
MALAAGKPVYVEKPMALNSLAAARMAEAAKIAGLPLVVAHYRRQQPLFLKVKQLLSEAVIGRPISVAINLQEPHNAGLVANSDIPWRLDPAVSGGGLFWDLAPHALDLILHWFGAPEWAAGSSWNARQTYKVPDTTIGSARLPGEIAFTGQWIFGAPGKTDQLVIEGTEGRIECSVFSASPLVLTGINGQETRFDFEPLAHVQEPMIAAVTSHFLGRAPNPASAEDGLMVMRWMEAFS